MVKQETQKWWLKVLVRRFYLWGEVVGRVTATLSTFVLALCRARAGSLGGIVLLFLLDAASGAPAHRPGPARTSFVGWKRNAATSGSVEPARTTPANEPTGQPGGQRTLNGATVTAVRGTFCRLLHGACFISVQKSPAQKRVIRAEYAALELAADQAELGSCSSMDEHEPTLLSPSSVPLVASSTPPPPLPTTPPFAWLLVLKAARAGS